LLVADERFPLLNTLFRNVNQRLTILSPLEVDSKLQNVELGGNRLKGDLRTSVTEKRTGKGVPLAPIEIYINDKLVHKGRCDARGKHTYKLELDAKQHRAVIDVYHSRKRLTEAFDTLTTLWDDYDDEKLDRRIWEVFKGTPAYYIGKAEVREEDGFIKFISTNTGYLAGIKTISPVDISKGRISVRMRTGGWVVCALTILPSTEGFYGASYNKGYDVVIWEYGLHKFVIYSGPDIAYVKGTLRANPDNIEVILEDETIRFIEEGVEVYSETYKPPSKLCNIYLWGQSWYHLRGGTSWVDNLLFRGE